MRQIDHFMPTASPAPTRKHQVWNPSTGEVQAEVVLGDAALLDQAVATAQSVQPAWAATNPQKRARVMFKFKELVEANMQSLAELLSSEHGKTVPDAMGDVQRGLEVIEYACGIPQVLKGEYTPGAGPGIDVITLRQPLGIGAGITPFNFPAMIPMWMFGMACAAGNAFILKPSERDPSVPVRLAELFVEAGAPEGLLQVVHGDKEMVDAILQHPVIKAVSFVGSSDIAHYVYHEATKYGKRAQCMGGAKNHGIIMPDANMDQAVKDILGAAYGSAGERCMAISVAVPVTDAVADALVAKLEPMIQALKTGPASDRSSDMGPVVTKAAQDKITGLITKGEEEGAKIVVDGRDFTAPQGYENGFFVGPHLFDKVTPEMDIYKTEIFGPVLSTVRAGSYEEALGLAMDHEYGNGTAIFTRDGDTARDFASRVNIGMVGINVPIPVPLAYHTFGGWKKSVFGDLNQHGPDSFKFYTRTKTVTARWPSGIKEGGEFNFKAMD